MSFNHGLQPGQTIINNQLKNIFKCSSQGGMRRSHKTNTLVIISDHIKSIYNDRWVDGIFHYTGMGQTGHQSLAFAQNKTLAESNHNEVTVYLFEVFISGQYTFIGQVQLANDPYQEKQPDKNNNDRNVWVFPLKLKDSTEILLPKELINKKQETKEKQARSLTDKELKKRASQPKKASGYRTVTTSTYNRDPYVSEYALRKANGICQLCESHAPFKDKNGKPFLETHHIEWLSDGGEDSTSNTVALCPNCHRKMHFLNLKADKEKLMQKAAQDN